MVTREDRFRSICDAMDAVMAQFDLKAGENIYLLTVLLLGSIGDAPADIRELFRSAAVQVLLRQRGSGSVLQSLCLDGDIPEQLNF